MIQNLPRLAKRYQVALRKHLEDGNSSDLTVAHKLGRQVVRMGAEILDLAKIHEEALLHVVLPHHSTSQGLGMIRRCVVFFAEAAAPLEATHRGVREAGEHLKVMLETLTERTLELATSNQVLKQEIAHRQAIEDSLRISEQTSSQLLKKSCELQEELRQLSRRLLTAHEEERRRISRDLHDVITQTLTGINLRLVALKGQSVANARQLHQKIAVTQRLVEKSVNLVHRFARELRPALLDDLGLIPALKAHLKEFMEQGGVQASLTVYAGVEKLSWDVRTVLYRVVQEALKNVKRHARATHVTVRLFEHAGKVCLEIHDNGCGFDVTKARYGKGSKRLGLLGMRERVEMVGGTFAALSALGQETTLRIEIPLLVSKPIKGSASKVKKRAIRKHQSAAPHRAPL
jgi:signal transduction histidine kinase